MKRMHFALSVLIVATMLTASFSALCVITGAPQEQPQRAGISSYTTHNRITINGDAGFLGANSSTGISRGNGSVSNPYIIEGWEINASSGVGIRIDGTTKHFVIRDCYIHNGSYAGSNDGIYLSALTNATLANNTFFYDAPGIRLYDCDNCTLVNNTCRENVASNGIILDTDCDNNNLTGNTCSGCYVGIRIDINCDNNTVVGNICHSNSRGIFVYYYSRNNTIIGNNCYGNDDTGIFLTYCDDCSVLNNSCCDNVGRGINLLNTGNTTVEDNNCSGNYYGIEIDFASNYNTIANNTFCSNSQYGIYAYMGPHDNTITGNNCSDTYRGICLQTYCNNTAIFNNTCNDNSQVGVFISSSCIGNEVAGNNCSGNYQGISVSNAPGNTVSNNTLLLNWGYGILLSGCGSGVVADNVCTGGSYGIQAAGSSSGVTIRNNSVSECTYGIFISYSTGCTIDENNLTGCGMAFTGSTQSHWDSHGIGASNTVNGLPIYMGRNLTGLTVPAGYGQIILINCTDFSISGYTLAPASYGIAAAFCSGLLIENCNLTGNFNGAYIYETDDVTMANCTCLGGQYCLRVIAVDNSTFTNNTFTGASCGIYLETSENVTIAANDCTGDYYGIFLYMLVNGTVGGNDCSGCSYGLYLDECNGGTFELNNCSGCYDSGIYIYRLENGAISNNTCSGNTYGMEVDVSNSNLFDNNNCSGNDWGVYIYSYDEYDNSNNNTFASNSMCGNANECVFVQEYSCDNAFYGNVFIGNNGSGSAYDPAHCQARDDGINSSWNASGGSGNYWSDWAAQGAAGLPYNISGSSGAKDVHPLAFIPGSDAVAPTTSASAAGTAGLNGWFTSNVSLTLTGVDTGSGVKITFYRIDGGSWAEYTGEINLTADGTYLLEFRSRDNVGNNESVKNVTVKVDKTAPATSASKSGSFVTLTATDATSGVDRTMFRVNGGSWQVYNGTFEVNGTGNNTVEYYSVDNAGNEGAIKTVYVDNSSLPLELILIIVVVIAVVVAAAVAIVMRKKSRLQAPPQTPPTNP